MEDSYNWYEMRAVNWDQSSGSKNPTNATERTQAQLDAVPLGFLPGAFQLLIDYISNSRQP